MTKIAVRAGPLSMKMYCAIGMVAVSWARLEEVITICLARLLGANYVEFLTVGANMPAKARLDSIKALAGVKLAATDAAALIKLCDEAIQISRARNQVLHGAWLQSESPDVGIRVNYRAQGRMTVDTPSMSAKEIATIADQTNALADKFAVYLQTTGLMPAQDPPVPQTGKSAPFQS